MSNQRILIIGVTASGKARLGFELARSLGGEIISVDSMKVYRRMDLGTAKPPRSAQEAMAYHLIDVVEPQEAFSTGLFLQQALAAAENIEQRGHPVVAVGGTALYIKALLHGLFEGPGADPAIRQRLQDQADTEGSRPMHATLATVDPEAAERINCNDTRRIVRALEVYELTGRPISSFQTQFTEPVSNSWRVIGLRREKAAESQRINARVRRMVEDGLVAEVEGLLNEPHPLSRQAAAAIGYAEIIAHLEGTYSLDEAVEKIKINTRRMAKHQRTWYKTFAQVQWLDLAPGEPVEDTLARVSQMLASPAATDDKEKTA